MVEQVFPDCDYLDGRFFWGGGGRGYDMVDSKKRDNSKPVPTKFPVSAECSTEFWTNTLDQNLIRNI